MTNILQTPVIMYKLVSQNYTSRGEMKWEIGKTNRATNPGTEMCTDQVLHCYEDPHLAIIFNLRHANIKNPKLFEIHCSPIVADDGLKFACHEQTPIREFEVPVITLNQKIAFGIKCALSVCSNPKFVLWANNWLTGIDRTRKSAAAYTAAAIADADDAIAADADTATYAAYTAAYAAAAAAAAYTANAAAAYAAAYAAAAAYKAAKLIFKSIIQEVLLMENLK